MNTSRLALRRPLQGSPKFSPRREGILLSEHVFTIFQRSISISDRVVDIAAATALTCILIWTALYPHRSNMGRRHHADGDDPLVQDLARILGTLGQLAIHTV